MSHLIEAKSFHEIDSTIISACKVVFDEMGNIIDENFKKHYSPQLKKNELRSIFKIKISNHVIALRAHDAERDLVHLLTIAFEQYNGHYKEWICLLVSREIQQDLIPIEDIFSTILLNTTHQYLKILKNNPNDPEHITPRMIITIQHNSIIAFQDIAMINAGNLQHLMLIIYNEIPDASRRMIIREPFIKSGFQFTSSSNEVEERNKNTKLFILEMEKFIQENIDQHKVI